MVYFAKHSKINTLSIGGFNPAPLEEVITMSTESFEHSPIGMRETLKYVTFNQEELYLMIVSQRIGRPMHSLGYNVILSTTSYSDELNLALTRKFTEETGIRLDIQLPANMQRMMQRIELTFRVAAEHPEEAMRILTGKTS